ncbi:MAG TPA: hypothetical protein VJT73_21935 [Polyangiaceae bacterium]|nr:hypothetical protein [Polyangiaceae bacterium]
MTVPRIVSGPLVGLGWAVLVASTACFTAGQKAPTLQTSVGPNGQPAISPDELSAMTESLADTYAMTIAQAVTEVQRTKPAPEIRSYAQHLKVFVGTTAYSLAASPNPEIAIIDLVVNISVQRSVIGRSTVSAPLGDGAAMVQKAYEEVDSVAWTQIARVYSPQQLDLLRDGIARWLDAHRDWSGLQFIRLPALARYRNVSPLTTPGSITLLQPVAEGARAAMQLRLLGERSLYLAQRFPYLINWQSEQVLYDALDTPETRSMLGSTTVFAETSERFAKVMGELPSAELLRGTVAELNGTLREAAPLLGSMRGIMAEMNQTLAGADRLLAPFQSPAVGGGPGDRTFDVGQYVAALRELSTTARELNQVLLDVHGLVASPELHDRMGDAQSMASSGFSRVGQQGDRWIDRIFWRAVAFVVVFFAALLLYRALATRLVRRS